MNNKKKPKGNRHVFDTAFINPCIDTVLRAIEQIQKGARILLVFENPLNRGDSFQVTRTFPFNALEIPKTYKLHKTWRQIFMLCPHLIQPQKIIYAHSKRSKPMAKIVDLLYGNSFNEKSEILDQAVPENLSFLNNNSINGVIFQEYRVNVSRLFIEILKFFENSGGKIIINKSFQKEEISLIIHCQTHNRRSYIIPQKVPKNFAITYKSAKNIFLLIEHQNVLKLENLNPDNIDLTKQEIMDISKSFVFFENETISDLEMETYLSNKTIRNIVRLVKSPLPNTISNSGLKDNYELCLEKFDIAKQTGIDYNEFKILFHRYGAGMDEMIDLAYEKMNLTRDVEKIWKTAELEYQYKNEWKA